MSKINVLEKQVAELIAAGEVVERPASIAKELVENSIDAGATSITVEVQRGGIGLLRVTDNGEGMSPEDVPTAFIRHATSKVRVQEDLQSIHTMGFRGEALPSICAMCRVEVLTRTKADAFGTRYVAEGGEMLLCEEAGVPVGTTMIVRDVFFNTPARMKFLKKEPTEAANVGAFVEKAALSHPEIGFRFIKDGEIKLNTPGDGKLQSAIRAVLGGEFAKNMAAVDYKQDGVHVTGFVTLPSVVKGSRGLQHFFINRRYVQSKTCMAALEEAYKGKLMVGRFPGCVLNLHMPPQLVDVNVHPAKIQVRFADERAIFHSVYYGTKSALEMQAHDRENWGRGMTPPKDFGAAPAQYGSVQDPAAPTKLGSTAALKAMGLKDLKSPPARMSAADYRGAVGLPKADDNSSANRLEQLGNLSPALQKYTPVPSQAEKNRLPDKKPPEYAVPTALRFDEPQQQLDKPSSFANARLVGELFRTYIVMEQGSDLLLVDKHAAHERILYNRLLEEGIGAQRQLLLAPINIALSPAEYGVVLENLDLFSKGGLELEDFGGDTVLLREVAPVLQHMDCAVIVEEFARQLAKGNDRMQSVQLEKLYHTISCRSAIKGGDDTPLPSLEQLIHLLEAEQDASCCPHGRPICVRMTEKELEKLFGRLG